MSTIRRSFGVAVAATLIAFAMGVGAQSASAWPDHDQDGAWLVYHDHSYAWAKANPGLSAGSRGGPHGQGAQIAFGRDDADLGDDRFREYGDGVGQVVKNNAGAYNETRRTVRVYYNSLNTMGCWCGSKFDDVAPGGRDLRVTYNDNAAHHMLTNR